MARTKTISSIDAALAKAESELSQAQKKVDILAARVLELQKQKQEQEANQIMEAYRKSGKTFDEVLTFFNV